MRKQKPFIQYENTVPGTFIKRLNRFSAEVLIDGEPEMVHVKNTGRMRELLVPNARITLQRIDKAERKTAYDLISVYKPRLSRNTNTVTPDLISIWSRMGKNTSLK